MKDLGLLLMLLPAIAGAEVMDKVGTLSLVWSWGVGLTAAGYMAGRYRPWLLVGVFLLLLVLFGALISDVTSADIGPTIQSEAGSFYIGSVWTFPFLVALSAALGTWFRRQAAHPEPTPDAPRKP
ncbi:hypothetical protein [Zoogloea dura]|uniref:Uncharacterized protein n=1 Tax=Zoogloea dura TaxID=2728840 RepID=A0A848G570_9RHOO|nr:hypothetical protein [Zoogloea dura]NML26350.1 hypothetical protein [Zoogloea dura]